MTAKRRPVRKLLDISSYIGLLETVEVLNLT